MQVRRHWFYCNVIVRFSNCLRDKAHTRERHAAGIIMCLPCAHTCEMGLSNRFVHCLSVCLSTVCPVNKIEIVRSIGFALSLLCHAISPMPALTTEDPAVIMGHLLHVWECHFSGLECAMWHSACYRPGNSNGSEFDANFGKCLASGGWGFPWLLITSASLFQRT